MARKLPTRSAHLVRPLDRRVGVDAADGVTCDVDGIGRVQQGLDVGFVGHAGVGVPHHREHSGDDGRGEGGSVDAGGCGGDVGSQGEGLAGSVDVHGGAAPGSVRAVR